MSALFPNVPMVPGVPPVNRAPDRILSALNGAESTLLAARIGHQLLDDSDFAGATTAFISAGGFADGAFAQVDPVFSPGAPPLVSLYMATGAASGAVNAIGAGSLSAAALAADNLVSYATDAIAQLTDNLAGTPEEPLPDSGPEVQADISQQWGLYTQDGQPAAPADNVLAIEVMLDAQISDYPVENGGFGSYNKVQRPYDVRLAMSRGGTVEDRQAFLQAIQTAWQSVDLYNVITPECVYLDVNVVGVRRTVMNDHGLGLMTLEVSLRKVRQTAKLAFVQTKEPEGAQTVNDGAVQTQPSALAGSPR